MRFPSDYSGRFAKEPLTNVNVFRFVFSYLADDESLLDTRVEDDGFFELDHLLRGVESGQLLETPVPFDSPRG